MMLRRVLQLLAVLMLAVPVFFASAGASAAQSEAQFKQEVRQAAVNWPRVQVGTEPDKCTWQSYTLTPGKEGLCGFVFKTPPNEQRDMFWAFSISARARFKAWYIIPLDPSVQLVGFQDFYSFNDARFEAADLPEKNRTFLQDLRYTGTMLQPNTQYIIWMRFGNSEPVHVWLAVNVLRHKDVMGSAQLIARMLGLKPKTLPLACQLGLTDQVAVMLKADPAAINTPDAEGKRPLEYAVLYDYPELVSLLAGRGADLNASDSDGSPPLIDALEQGASGCAAVLIEHGVNLSVASPKGRTPLHLAVQTGSMALVSLLCQHKADLSARVESQPYAGCTPLHLAVEDRDAAITRYLLSKGAPVNATDGAGRTPLHMAAAFGDARIAGLLLEKGANANALDHRGFTPLDYAVRDGREDVAALLRRHGGLEAPGQPAGRKADEGQEPEMTPCPLLNGHNSYFYVRHSASLDLSGVFTVELYLRLNSCSIGSPGIITRDNPGIGPWEMSLDDGRLTTKVAGGNWNHTPPETAYGPLPVDEWLHLAMVHDGPQVRVYVNGKKVAQHGAPARLVVNSNDLKIGCSLYRRKSIDGMVREVRISNVARYSGDFKPQWRFKPDPQTILLLHCDEGRGEAAHDSSGHGNDAQLMDAHWALP